MLAVAVLASVATCVLVRILDAVQAWLSLHAPSRAALAFVDNAIHAIIAAASWICVEVVDGVPRPLSHSVKEVIVCAILASVIDIDHFLAAGSIDLKVRYRANVTTSFSSLGGH